MAKEEGQRRERERESSPSQGRELETIKSETRGKANIRWLNEDMIYFVAKLPFIFSQIQLKHRISMSLNLFGRFRGKQSSVEEKPGARPYVQQFLRSSLLSRHNVRRLERDDQPANNVCNIIGSVQAGDVMCPTGWKMKMAALEREWE